MDHTHPVALGHRMGMRNRPPSEIVRRTAQLMGTQQEHQRVLAITPFAEPLRHKTFHFSRAWMQSQAARMSNAGASPNPISAAMRLAVAGMW